MAYNLSGNWHNRNPKDGDTVTILHLRDDFIQVIGYCDGALSFRNIGIGIIDGDYLFVEWTDLPDSNGTERGIAHRAKIKIISNSELKLENDSLLPSMKKSSNNSYGDWIRS